MQLSCAGEDGRATRDKQCAGPGGGGGEATRYSPLAATRSSNLASSSLCNFLRSLWRSSLRSCLPLFSRVPMDALVRLHSGCFVASSRWMFLWRLHSGWFSDGGPAVQPPGLSYKAHWEVLGCALCLLTTTAISRTGPVWNRAFAPAPAALVFLLDHVLFPSYMYVSPMYLCSCSTIWFLFCKTEIRIGTGKKPRVCVCDSRRPRARVPLVVWAWDLVVIRLHCCGLPAPARRQFFALRFATVCH